MVGLGIKGVRGDANPHGPTSLQFGEKAFGSHEPVSVRDLAVGDANRVGQTATVEGVVALSQLEYSASVLRR